MTEGGSTLKPEDLASLEILTNVALEAVWGLLEHCPVRELAPDDVLLTKGASNQTMYLLLSGSLSVHLSTPEDDPVALLKSGVSVGEMSVIDGSPASAHVIAASAARLLAIDEETFWRLVRASHGFAANLLQLLAKRMRATNTTAVESDRLRKLFERASMVDALTGLNNRRWLLETLPRIINREQGDGRPVSVVMLDVDHFKKFNDTYGHSAGDHVLASVAHVILTRLRPLDIGVRYGGEEFVIVLPDTNVSGACVAAERLRMMIEQLSLVMPDGIRLPRVTISLGVAEVEMKQDAETVLDRADAAMYRAKNHGRNRVEMSL